MYNIGQHRCRCFYIQLAPITFCPLTLHKATLCIIFQRIKNLHRETWLATLRKPKRPASKTSESHLDTIPNRNHQPQLMTSLPKMEERELGCSCSVLASSRSLHGVSSSSHFVTEHVSNHVSGFPYCYGVFRAYFYNNPPFKGQNIISIGGVLSNVCSSLLALLTKTICAQGVLQIALPPVIYYVNNFPKQRKLIMWLGCIICTVSAIGAGFATTVC